MRKNKTIAAISLLLLMLTLCASANALVKDSSILADVEVSGKITLKQASHEASIEEVIANLSFYPKAEQGQQVISLTTNPGAEKQGDTIQFVWNKPLPGTLEFRVESRVKTTIYRPAVRGRVKFPLEDGLVKQYEEFTLPTEYVESENPQIVMLASSIVEGDDDLMIAVSRLAGWVRRNIAYNLTSITADAIQPASWVLENRKGVCDELSTLFIAMVRSLGIPARFVAGLAYSDLPEVAGWGSHGWAEVYFPGYGWVPFDISYDEFGYVDATHIKLREVDDPKKASTEYQWRGRGTSLIASPLKLAVKVIDRERLEDKAVDITASLISDEVRLGSYDLIRVRLRNRLDSYAATGLTFSRSPGLRIIDYNNDTIEHEVVVLRPGEEKEINYAAHIDSLDEAYIYTFHILIVTDENASAELRLKAFTGADYYPFEYFYDSLMPAQRKARFALSVECTMNKTPIYVYETALALCRAANKGNAVIRELRICHENDCKEMSIGISQEPRINFSVNFSEPGKNEVVITAKSANISKAEVINLEVLDAPTIALKQVPLPDSVRYGHNFNASFSALKLSKSTPYITVITFSSPGYFKRWELGDLDADHVFVVELNSADLKAGNNTIRVEATYLDGNSRSYSAEKSFKVFMETPTIWERIRYMIRLFLSLVGFE